MHRSIAAGRGLTQQVGALLYIRKYRFCGGHLLGADILYSVFLVAMCPSLCKSSWKKSKRKVRTEKIVVGSGMVWDCSDTCTIAMVLSFRGFSFLFSLEQFVGIKLDVRVV